MSSGSDAFHGASGELTVCRARGPDPLFDAFSRGGRRRPAIRATTISTAPSRKASGGIDFTIRNGKRWSHVERLPAPGAATAEPDR